MTTIDYSMFGEIDAVLETKNLARCHQETDGDPGVRDACCVIFVVVVQERSILRLFYISSERASFDTRRLSW